ncbi:hypothetical protein CFC21_082217 [Triticum aestivum]|uniref:BTB domain-containing protein n=2 Tax=Triticum aestivum TaxID=4565 RepID=A0A9R1L4S0_WHEAT|nr:hypothetical protein CFC21_082216 [Triticum aestivum]KAF7077693.1 hypothetical protein CFC21_082217 [Triticum aestivum]
MAFAGASLVADGKLCAATESVVDSGADCGYHLLFVQGYSRTNFIDQPELRVPKHIRQSQPVYLDERLDGQYEFMKIKDFERSRHLKDDSFILRCDLVVCKPGTNTKGQSACSAARPFTKLPPPDLQSRLANLLLSKECADITFEVGGEEFAAHRCLLVARSTVFRAQLSGAMNESCVVKISGIKADVFRGLLTFIYTDAVPDFMEADDDDVETFATRLLEFLEAAERYDLEKLKTVCEEKLADFLCADMESDIIVNELLSKFALLNL